MSKIRRSGLHKIHLLEDEKSREPHTALFMTILSSIENAPHARGRPREFNIDQALASAMEIFWNQGYHATSVHDLTQAMGLTKGSLYKAFKDKKAVFLAAFERYVAIGVIEKFDKDLLDGRPPLELIQSLLLHYARICSSATGKRGCLVTATAMEMLPHDQEVMGAVSRALERIHRFLLQALMLAKKNGSLDAKLDEKGAALFLLSLIQGMRVLGKTAPTEQRLKQVVRFAMVAINAGRPA